MIMSLDGIEVSALRAFPPPITKLFFGPLAYFTYGGNPALCDGTHEVPPTAEYFELSRGSGIVGGVLVQDINQAHRRASLHVGIVAGHRRSGVARKGLIAVGALLGEAWGFEYIYTWAVPGSPTQALAEACGLKVQGLLVGYSSTPGGRGDALILGGLWSELRELHKSAIGRIDWSGEEKS